MSKKTAAQKYMESDLKYKVQSLLDNRRRLLAPFPIDPMEIYRMAYSKEEYAAIKVLRHHGEKMFETSNKIVIKGYPLGAKTHEISVFLQKEEWPTNGKWQTDIRWDNVELEAATKICDWAPVWIEYKDVHNRLINKLESIAEYCSTYGQAFRLWPDLIGFFGGDGRQVIREKKVKSRYPSELMEWDESAQKWILMEGWTPEDFEPFTTVIAECLMLPETKGSEVALIE